MADEVPHFMKMGKYGKKPRNKLTSCCFILLFKIQVQNIHPFPVFLLTIQFFMYAFVSRWKYCIPFNYGLQNKDNIFFFLGLHLKVFTSLPTLTFVSLCKIRYNLDDVGCRSY